jgi:hypothetical protein
MITCRRFLVPCVSLVLLASGRLAAGEERGDNKVFLWEARSATATVYLLGSVHAVNHDLYPLDPRIERAYEASDFLVVEANVAGEQALAAGVAMMGKAMYPADDSLDRHISKEVVENVGRRMGKLGLPLDANRFKPWFLSVTITMAELAKVGILAQNGIDLHFLQKAAGKKKILELESVDFQTNLLDSFTDKEQESFLKQTLRDADRFGEQIKGVIEGWKRGDAAVVEKLLRDSEKEAPELRPVNAKLIDDRNKTMAAKVEGYLATDKTYFVVVGAAHLVGETGIVNLLGKKYKVAQQ